MKPAPGDHLALERLGNVEAAALVADVQRFIPALQSRPPASFAVQKKPLLCYEDYELVRIADLDSDATMLLGLYAPGDFWPLDEVGIQSVNKLSPLHLTSETVEHYADLFLGSRAEGARLVTALTDGAGFLIQQSDTKQLKISTSGSVTRQPPLSMPPIPRVRAILGVRRWTEVQQNSPELDDILHKLQWNVGRRGDDADIVVRRADISFYREHRLYEVLRHRKAAAVFQQYYFLYTPGGMIRPLDGESQVIHQTNSAEPPTFAGDADVADYLRFFCWATLADEGRFHIVERFRDIPWERAPDKSDRQAILRRLESIKIAPAATTGGRASWICSAIVSYGSHLFLASFTVSANGLVEMTNDVPVAVSLPVIEFQPGRLTIDRSLTGNTRPVTYLDEYPTESQQPDGDLVTCTPQQFLARIEALNGTVSERNS